MTKSLLEKATKKKQPSKTDSFINAGSSPQSLNEKETDSSSMRSDDKEKKYATYYLSKEIIKEVKKAAIDHDEQPANFVERVLREKLNI